MAQTPATGSELFRMAGSLFDQGDHAGSIAVYQKAAVHYQSQDSHPQYIRSLNKLARVYETTGEASLRKSMIEEGIREGKRHLPANHPELGVAYMQRGEVHLVEGEMEEAGKMMEMGLRILENSDYHEDRVWCRCDLSVHAFMMGDLEAMKGHLEVAWEACEAHLPPEHAGHYLVLDLFGMLYDATGEFDEALEAAKKSLQLQLAKPEKSAHDSLALANSYNMIGAILYSMGDFSQSIDHYRKSLDLYRRSSDPPAIDLGRCLNNLGLALDKNQQLDEAFEALQQAAPHLEDPKDLQAAKEQFANLYNLAAQLVDLEDFEQAEQLLDQGLALAGVWKINPEKPYFFYGKLRHHQGEYASAIKHYRQSISTGSRKFKSPNFKMGSKYFSLAESFMARQALDSALYYLQIAIHNYSYDFTGPSPADNPEPDSDFAGWRIISCLERKGRCLLEMQRQKPTEDKWLSMAHATYLLGVKVIDRFRAEYRAPGSKAILAQTALPMYEGAIRTSLDRFERDGCDSCLHQAFLFVEQSKSLLLLEAQLELEAKGLGILPEWVAREEARILRKLTFYQGKILKENRKGEGKNEGKISHWNARIFDLKKRREQWNEWVEKRYPEYGRMKKRKEMAGTAEIAGKLLDEGELFVEYFIGEKELYTFVIGPEGLKAYRQPLPEDFLILVGDLCRNLGDHAFIRDSVRANYESYTHSAFELYRMLLAPVLESHPSSFDKLLIVPDGPLSQIPFDALLSQPAAQSRIDYLTLAYVLRRWRLRYGYSASLLLEMKERGRKQSAKQCLAFAPTYAAEEGERGELAALRGAEGALPGAQGEIQALSQSGIPGEFLFGQAATEAIFKAQSPNFNILHLALHGEADLREPMNSKILFTQTVMDSTEDHVLYAYELQNMVLNAQLVVLSACESGSGKYQPGEGLLSLGRSFMQAGAVTVVMTLWKVEDGASARLMGHFYEGIKAGALPSDALHKAKLKFLKQADSWDSHPAFWAAFVLNGAQEPISWEDEREGEWPLLGYLVVALLLGMWLFWKRRPIPNRSAHSS